LRDVFAVRGIADLFNGGIFGSPDQKEDILARELAEENICHPALFIGDSKYDHVAAAKVGLDFVFASAWTEFTDWEAYCHDHGISAIGQISDLIK